MRWLLLGALVAVMLGFQQIAPALDLDVSGRAALVFGFLLLAGFLLGELLAPLGLPRVTGYLFAGMGFGGSALGIVDAEVVAHLHLVDDLALSLIAFTAGGELRIDRVRARGRSILSITFIQTAIVFVLMTGLLWLVRAAFPFGADLDGLGALRVMAVLGLIATAKSPATTVAVIVETRARGPLTDTVLGVTMLKDIVVLVAASVLLALVAPKLQGRASLGLVLGEIGLSFVAGVVVGALMIAYLRWVRRELVLFVLASAFLLISVSHAFHLHSILVAMAAGFTVTNASRHGAPFLDSLERASAPVFLVFFCLSGAILNLGVLVTMWHVTLLYVGLRVILMWLGTAAGALVARDDAAIRRHAWTGFLGQAGVSLGLAAMVRQSFPDVGGPVADLIVGGIVLNQVIGPILFRRALIRSGEGR